MAVPFKREVYNLSILVSSCTGSTWKISLKLLEGFCSEWIRMNWRRVTFLTVLLSTQKRWMCWPPWQNNKKEKVYMLHVNMTVLRESAASISILLLTYSSGMQKLNEASRWCWDVNQKIVAVIMVSTLEGLLVLVGQNTQTWYVCL